MLNGVGESVFQAVAEETETRKKPLAASRSFGRFLPDGPGRSVRLADFSTKHSDSPAKHMFFPAKYIRFSMRHIEMPIKYVDFSACCRGEPASFRRVPPRHAPARPCARASLSGAHGSVRLEPIVARAAFGQQGDAHAVGRFHFADDDGADAFQLFGHNGEVKFVVHLKYHL